MAALIGNNKFVFADLMPSGQFCSYVSHGRTKYVFMGSLMMSVLYKTNMLSQIIKNSAI
jgi:hypothetical protein